MNREALRQFLVDANKAGYASGEERQWVKEADGSTTIPFEQDEWRMDDNYFGGEPYGGREMVFFQGRPAWIMVYYGWVNEGVSSDEVYAILRQALMHMPAEHPFRGPAEFRDGELAYLNSWTGDIERFSGEETISKDDRLLYKANYIGGLIDQRKG